MKHLTQHKNGTWYYQRRYNGERVRFSLNTKDDDKAQILRDKINHQLEEKGFIAAVELPETPLFGQVVVDWFQWKKPDIRKSTRQNYEEHLRNYILKASFVNKPVNAITFQEIEQWYPTLKLGNTVLKMLVLLSGIFKYATRMGWITTNPVPLVHKPKMKRTKPDVFSIDEVERIIANSTKRYKNYIEFKFFTGLRSSEIGALKFGDIDLKAKRVRIQRGIVYGVVDAPKNEFSDRIITLNDRAYNALIRQIKERRVVNPEAFVFLNKYGNPIESVAFNRSSWKSILKKAGVRYRPSKFTRHTYISLALDAGERPIFVSTNVGHANTGQVMRTYQGYLSYGNDGRLFGRSDPRPDPNPDKQAGGENS